MLLFIIAMASFAHRGVVESLSVPVRIFLSPLAVLAGAIFLFEWTSHNIHDGGFRSPHSRWLLGLMFAGWA